MTIQRTTLHIGAQAHGPPVALGVGVVLLKE